MAGAQCPSLPSEIWTRIFQYVKDDDGGFGTLPQLWMFRHVCSTFKGAVEYVFRQEHLPNTWIDIRFGNELPDEEIDIFRCTFAFSHVSEDMATAIFRMDSLSGEGDEPTAFIYEYLQTYAAEMSYAIQQPSHVIQVRHILNDTPIPGLSFHFDKPEDAARMNNSAIPKYDNLKGLEKLQLHCDWRELYVRFWGEELLSSKLNSDWVKRQEERARSIGAGMERGEEGSMDAFKQLLSDFAKTNDEGRKIARRARVRRQLKEIEGQEAASQHIIDESLESMILKSLARK